MGTLTIRNLDDEVKRELRLSAARRGVSMEQEARDRLRQPLPGVSESSRQAGWRPDASLEELLALGIRPDTPIDHKAESDALYDYLEKS